MGSNSEVGKKFDQGKDPVYMGVLAYFPRAIRAVAGVSVYGANKYKLSLADKNWMKVPEGFARYSDAMARHVLDSTHETFDPESKLLIDAHAAWNALARLELLLIDLEAKEKK